MEVFVIACRRLESVPSGAELPWLLGCARRVLANQRRGQRRADALADRLRDSLRTAEVDPQTSRALSDAFSQLGETDQEVLLLAAWEGLTPHELGVALGCSRTAAAVRLHRARRRFRSVFTATVDEETTHSCAEVAR
jgi:RNA polymerase sigma factor (sigma-70 family)